MTTPTTPAAARVAFERDAEPMGFDLRRHECMVPEPWSEYRDINTGHRWGGYLAATHAATARESALIAERDALRAAIEVCLSFVHADDRSKPSTDPDLCGEIVRVRLSGLCALAEAVTPGIRLAAHQAFVDRTLDALSAPAVEGV